jgi:SAM-dependent methyltransferase
MNVYETFAAEYYDAARHPTCANFREASRLLIEPLVADYSQLGPVCEVGCGMSILADMLVDGVPGLDTLLLTDSAASMLEYSAEWIQKSAISLIADAAELPLGNDSVGFFVASLGDPYNGTQLWSELSRVLSPGGHIVFTTPSYEWASRYRASEGSEISKAEFWLADGSVVAAPSIILDAEAQTKMIVATQSLQVINVQAVRYSRLPSLNISPKLKIAEDGDLPIVTAYVARKG